MIIVFRHAEPVVVAGAANANMVSLFFKTK